MNIGQRIREVREDLGMQAAVLARRVEVAPNTIYRIENGDRMPSVGLLEKIARELRTEPAELMREPVPLAEAPQESGPPQVSREDLEKLGIITVTDPELKELNNELASFWYLWVRGDKAHAWFEQENVDKNRVLMLMHLVLGTPDIISPQAAVVVNQGMMQDLKTG